MTTKLKKECGTSLVNGANQDDIESGCSGIPAKFSRKNGKSAALILTKGEIQSRNGSRDTVKEATGRHIEIKKWWTIVSNLNCFNANVSGKIDTAVKPDYLVNKVVRVRIGKNTRIDNGAVIQGPVNIGDNCLIGKNAFIHGPAVIGNNVKIGFSADIKRPLSLLVFLSVRFTLWWRLLRRRRSLRSVRQD